MNKQYGYIEGYYGRELTWLQRFALLTHIRFQSMNTYIYAPKEDPFHRVQWHRPYPPSRQKIMRQLVNHGKRIGINVILSIAPGLSYNYLSEDDYKLLLKKISSFIKCEVNTVALLMDDIPKELPASCRRSFSSLGEAHGLLLQRLLADINKENNNVKLWFCPTIYTDQFVRGNTTECRYIKDLVKTIPESVTILWTGPKVVSEKLTTKNIGSFVKLFKGNVIVWDNFFANDYAPLRLFVGPYTGREKSILKSTKGILINPTGLFHTDLFIISLFGYFLKNKKATVKGWDAVADEYSIPHTFRRVRKFFWSPWTSYSTKDISKSSLKKMDSLFDELLVKWQSPLRLEWHPYIQGLRQDITYLTIKKTDLKTWLNKRYPPIIAQRMVKR